MQGARCCSKAGSTGSRSRSRRRTWTSSRRRTPRRARSRSPSAVPPLLLGLPGDNTHANYAEANRAFYRQTVIPLVKRTAQALAQWLGPAFGGRAGQGLILEPDLDAIEALSTEREALWRRVTAADFLTADEKREAVGYGAGKFPSDSTTR